MAKFKTDKYKQGVARIFEAGYTVDDVAEVYPQFDLEAIQAVYDEWKANPQRGKAKSKTAESIGPVTPTTRKAISKAKPADLPESDDNVPLVHISGNRYLAKTDAGHIEEQRRRIKTAGKVVNAPVEALGVAGKYLADKVEPLVRKAGFSEPVAKSVGVAAKAIPYFNPVSAVASIPALLWPDDNGVPAIASMVEGQAKNAVDVAKKIAVSGLASRGVSKSHIPGYLQTDGATQGLEMNDLPAATQALIDVGALVAGAAHGLKSGKKARVEVDSFRDPFLENQPKAKVESSELLDDPFVRAEQEKDVKLDEPEPTRATEASAVEANKASDATQDIKPDASTTIPGSRSQLRADALLRNNGFTNEEIVAMHPEVRRKLSVIDTTPDRVFIHDNGAVTFRGKKGGSVKIDAPESVESVATTKPVSTETPKAEPQVVTTEPVAKNVTTEASPEVGATTDEVSRAPMQRQGYDYVDPKTINTAPNELQYKGDTDSKGVTRELKSVENWDPNKAGVMLVWKNPADGKTYVVNGHHRLELAQRLDIDGVLVKYIDAKNAAEARQIGALTNIAEGRGTAIDAAKVIRDGKMTAADLAAEGVSLTGKIASDGIELAKLNDNLFNSVVQERMSVSRAVTIAKAVPDHAQQQSLYELLKSKGDEGVRMTDSEISELARYVQTSPNVTATQVNLFGAEEIRQNLAVEKAKLSNWVKEQFKKQIRGFKPVSDQQRADLIADAGNTLNVTENALRAEQARQSLEIYNTLSMHSGSIAESLNNAAERLAAGENIANVRSELFAEIVPRLREIRTGNSEIRGKVDSRVEVERAREAVRGTGTDGRPTEPAVKPRRVAAPETPNVAMQDVNENILISSAQKAQQKGRTINEWISTIRGSGTQYGEYNPAIRATIKPYEKSARLSELGIDPELDVTIYRGVPDPKTQKIVSGDFVTTDKLSAENYTGGDVVSKKVKAKDIVVEHADEFDVKHPFYEGSEFIYSDSKNKLTYYTDSQLKSIWERSSSNPLEPTSEGTFTEPYEQPLLHTQEGGHDPMAGTTRSMFGADEVPIERVEKPVAQKPVDEGLFEIPDKLSGTNGLASSGKYAPPRKQTTTTMAVSSPTAPIEMPELVEIAKKINGSVPLVKRKLRLMHGTANGVFTADPFNPKIELRADLFLGEKINSYSTKSPKTPTERTEIMNRLRAKTAEEMRVPEDDIVVRYERTKHIGNDVYHVYRISEEAASKTLAHEIGHAMDFVPDKTLNRGNVLGRIATLNNWLKTTIGELPSTPDDFLTTTQRNAIRKQARADIQKHAQGASKEELADAISERYSELVNKELDSRGLVTRAKIMGELKNLTQEWKPFDELIDNNYTKYRYSGKELYADLVSVWFNDAELARGIAPKTSKMLESYMKRKPEVKAAYDAVQNRYHNREAVANHRLNGIYKMIADGDVERLASANKQKPMQNIRDWITTGLIDKNWPALKGNASRKAKGGNIAVEAEAAAQGIEELNHVSALVNDHYSRIDSKLLKPMAELGITPDDIGTYMFLKRVQTDRSQMANPLGHTNKSATETMEGLKARLGDERFQAVQTTVDQYRAMRESEVFPVVKDAGIYTPELMKHIEESTDYGKFAVTKYMESKFGGQVTAAVHHQYGTLQDIANPFTETILQDASMLVAAKRNTAKRALAKDLRNAGAIMPADMGYSHDIGGRVPKDPKNPELALFTYMDDGKPVHTYVDRDIAMLWKNDPTRASMAAQLWGSVTGVLRDVFVGKNVAWQARNISRDYRGTIKNISNIKNVADAARLAKCYRQAFSEVASDVFKGQRSQDISSGYKEMALPDTRVYSSKDTNYNNLVEQRVAEMVQHISSNDSKSSIVTKQFKALIDLLDKTGRVSEMTGKVAGYKYLKQYAPEISAKQRAHLVRTRVGTPDYMRRGAWNAITNNIFMFSNVNKEGMRSGAEAFLDNPTRYAWKVAAMDVVPKLIIAGIGLWGANTPVGKVIKKADEYDRRMYNIVPIGLVNDGKDAIYLRIPQDYEGQAISAAFYDAFHIDAEALAKDVSAMNPYRLNPLLDTAYKGYQLYALGVNPVDEYRQRNVISDQAYAAGGREQAKQFGAYAWNSLGGSTLMKMKSAPEILTDETAIQTALRMPGLNALGSFVRISHNGEISEVYDVLHQARKEAAQKQMNRKAMAVDAVNKGKSLGDTYSLLVKRNMIDPTTTSVREFARTYNKLSSRKNDNPWVSAVENATSYEEMKALFDAMPEEQRDSFPVHTKAQARARFSSMGLQKTKIKPTKPKHYLGKNQDD